MLETRHDRLVNTKDGAPATMADRPMTCAWPGGCEEPRAIFPSGPVVLCKPHWSARQQANKRRPAVDPVTGDSITVGQLAMRNWRRKRAEAAQVGS